MASLSAAAMIFLQGAVRAPSNDVVWIRVFLGIIAAALLLQAIGLVVGGIWGAKLFHKLNHISDTMEQKATPILVQTQELLDELRPKIRSITTEVSEVSSTVRQRTLEIGVTVEEINRTVRDINERTRAQVAHADSIIKEAMDSAEQVSQTVQEGVKRPLRQIVGVIAGVKTGLETLVARSPFIPKQRPPVQEYRTPREPGQPYDL